MQTTTQRSLSIPITAGTCENRAFSGGRWLYSGLLDFIFSKGSTIRRAADWRVFLARKCHRSPKCNTARLHNPRAPHRMPIPKLLSFSMNAPVCNLASPNWIRISGGFIPSGSAMEPSISLQQLSVIGRVDLFLLLTRRVSLLSASHFWSRLPASSSFCPRVRPLASILSVFGWSHPSYFYYCCHSWAVHLAES